MYDGEWRPASAVTERAIKMISIVRRVHDAQRVSTSGRWSFAKMQITSEVRQTA